MWLWRLHGLEPEGHELGLDGPGTSSSRPHNSQGSARSWAACTPHGAAHMPTMPAFLASHGEVPAFNQACARAPKPWHGLEMAVTHTLLHAKLST